MKMLTNGNIVINDYEYKQDEATCMFIAVCNCCGFTNVNNDMWAYENFQRHACLTKAGKPRKNGKRGIIRSATALEVFNGSCFSEDGAL